MAQVPEGSTAVMARRVQPPDSLDLFCTPPWGTRALIEHVLKPLGFGAEGTRQAFYTMTALEPCAGHRHMADVLADHFKSVYAADVFDYGNLDAVASFVGHGADVLKIPEGGVDWVITNPPFRLGEEIARRALAVARVGVALLLRLQWIESDERWVLFQEHPLTAFAPFSGRLPMVEGRWDPEASTATGYAWFVWVKPSVADMLLNDVARERLILIPPSAKRVLTRRDDVARFALRGVLDAGAGPLFGSPA